MYYMLECHGPVSPVRVSLRNVPMLDGVSWNSGAMITNPVPSPLRVSISGGPKDVLVPMFQVGMLALRDDVIAAMGDAGVDNLQLFDLVIEDPRTQQELLDYRAVNIVGLVAAADMSKSKATGGGPLIDVDFESVAIDETKARELLLFRLAECVSGIVVHERVKRSIERNGITGLDFVLPGDWGG